MLLREQTLRHNIIMGLVRTTLNENRKTYFLHSFTFYNHRFELKQEAETIKTTALDVLWTHR